MHELSIACEIIEIVLKEKESRALGRITEVGIDVGALSGIDPEALAFGFEAATLDTPLAEARLQVKSILASGVCNHCGKSFEAGEFVFACPHCGSSDLKITGGEKLQVTYLKVE